jgi:hypothetical protein
MKPKLVSALAALAFICAASLAASPQIAASPAVRPGAPLPASERFVFARTVGDKHDLVETRIRLVSEKGENWYELTSHSTEQDLLLKLDPLTLLANYTEVTSRGKDATLRRVTTILENKSSVGPDEIILTGFESLPYTLRAFPWGLRQKAKISFMGASGGGSFRFDIGVAGKETIAVGGQGIECWKAQLSLSGIMGTFFGKSYLWYSTAYPHYLVKSESASAGPGSPTSVLTLVSYTASDKAD